MWHMLFCSCFWEHKSLQRTVRIDLSQATSTTTTTAADSYAHKLTGFWGNWIIWLPCKFRLSSLLCPPSMREQRCVFSGSEQAQRLILRRGSTCFCSLSLTLSLWFVSWEKKKRVEWHRSDSKKLISHFTCSHLLLKGGKGLERARQGEIKGGSGNEPEGVIEALCDSAPLAYIKQMGPRCADNPKLRAFVWKLLTTASNGLQTGNSHESDLIIVFPYAHTLFWSFSGHMSCKIHYVIPQLIELNEITINFITITKRKTDLEAMTDEVRPLELNDFTVSIDTYQGQSPLLGTFLYVQQHNHHSNMSRAHSPGRK